MIIGIGTDVVEISRLERLIEKDTAVKKTFYTKRKRNTE